MELLVAWTCGKAVGILGTQECEQPVADFGVRSLPFAETSTKLIGFPSTAAQAMNCLAGLLYSSITTHKSTPIPLEQAPWSGLETGAQGTSMLQSLCLSHIQTTV